MKTSFLLCLAFLMQNNLLLEAEIKPKERNILSKEADAIGLADALITDNSWNRLPVYSDRMFWENLPEKIRQGYIAGAEKYLDYNWPVVRATDYLEFVRTGERRQEAYSACSNALISLVMGELVEGKGRFTDQIINGVWYYSEQTWWGWSAHLYFQAAGPGLPDINEPTVDLGVGEVTSNLSWTYYLFREEFDKTSPLIAARLRQAIMEKALDPYFKRNDWGYMGFTGGRPNNWNPWVNFNMLTGYLLIETDPERKRERIQRIVSSLDKFLNGYSDDGGCDEGPSYWGAAGAILYECLEMLKDATAGKFDVFDDPLIQNIGKYFYRVNIHAPYFINFADADARTTGDVMTVYRYGKAINDPVMQKFGAYLSKVSNWGDGPLSGRIGDQLKDLTLLKEIGTAESSEALVSDFWFPDTEVAGGRDKEGSFEGFFFGAKGGFNAESHNHNDVGSCILYFDGKPCLIDLGRETYVAKTFSPQRYDIWTMQSGFHNLPVINGAEQKDGENFRAKSSSFSATSKTVTFSTDISGAYPESARVKSWIRSYTLNRNKDFQISDKYELTDAVSGATTSSNLMTSCKVSQVKPGLLKLEGDGFKLDMAYDPDNVSATIEFIEVKDNTLKRYWPDGVTRIRLQFRKPVLKGSNKIKFTRAS